MLRFFQRIRFPFGINANLSRSGVGWSWGFAGIRYGVSSFGRKFISFGIPGTVFYFIKYLKKEETNDTHDGNDPTEIDFQKQNKIIWKNIK